MDIFMSMEPGAFEALTPKQAVLVGEAAAACVIGASGDEGGIWLVGPDGSGEIIRARDDAARTRSHSQATTDIIAAPLQVFMRVAHTLMSDARRRASFCQLIERVARWLVRAFEDDLGVPLDHPRVFVAILHLAVYDDGAARCPSLRRLLWVLFAHPDLRTSQGLAELGMAWRYMQSREVQDGRTSLIYIEDRDIPMPTTTATQLQAATLHAFRHHSEELLRRSDAIEDGEVASVAMLCSVARAVVAACPGLVDASDFKLALAVCHCALSTVAAAPARTALLGMVESVARGDAALQARAIALGLVESWTLAMTSRLASRGASKE